MISGRESHGSSDDDEEVAPPVANEMLSRNGQENWSSQPHQYAGQARVHNIVRERAGPTRIAERVCGQSPESSFKLFITQEMVNSIVTHTNTEGYLRFGQNWQDTNEDEMYTFFGLLLLAGVYHNKNSAISELWSHEDGRPIFNKSMKRNRFYELRRCIRFDDRASRVTRRQNDKFAPLRNVFNIFSNKCRSNYKPGNFLTVDEQLVIFRGRCGFKMFLPNKPGKYGLKVWALCDSETAYCCNLQPYTGKVGGERDIGQGTRVVLELTDHVSGSGRHITADNFFTDITLVRALLGRQLTYNGTMRKNKGAIPLQMMPARNRAIESSVFGFQRDLSLVSYVPKKNKAVVLLSSYHNDSEINPDKKNKPTIILDYNSKKAGVDTLDQVVRCYTCRRKTRRWPFLMFCNLLDVGAFNAFVLFLHVHPNYANRASHRRRLFLIELAKSLLPRAARENNAEERLPRVDPPGPVRNRKYARCYLCPRRQDKKSPTTCTQCNRNICKQHQKMMCTNC